MTDDQDDLDDSLEGFDGPDVDSQPTPALATLSAAARLNLNPLNSLDLLAEIDTRESPPPEPQPISAISTARQLAPARDTVPGIFARRSINLVIGSSTAGKTPLILTQLESYLTAEDHNFLGYPLPADQPPDQCAAIVCSGTLSGMHNRINALQLEALSDPTRFPIRDWDPITGETALDCLYRIYDLLSHAARQPIRFLFIDGLQLMLEGTGKVNDPHAVRTFYRQLNQFCLNRSCTILATIGMAKMRKGDYYPILADRVYGSTMWAQEAATLIGIEQLDLAKPVQLRPTARRLEVQPKAHTPQTLYVDFDDRGRLELIDYRTQDKESAFHSALDNILAAAPTGSVWTRDDLNVLGDSVGASGRTLERWITSRCHDSLALLERHGGTRNRTYRKPQVN